MLSTRKVWLAFVAVIAALTAATYAPAQGDYSGLKNGPERTGRNGDPITYGPGAAGVVWFWPNGLNRPGTILRDNPSTATLRSPNVASWGAPTPDEEGAYFYQAARTGNAGEDAVIGSVITDPFRAGGVAPGYEYAESVPSALNTPTFNSTLDPTTALNPADLKVFDWTVDPRVENATTPSLNYQLYIWLPNGPTGPVGGPGGQIYYPNRYYVLDVTYGTGQRWVEVIDTNFAGQGWVRIGNGGLPTNQVFPYAAGTPIHVRLYNTQWRDALNNILEDTLTTRRAVYADAVMAVPDNGSASSSPIVGIVGTGVNQRTQVIQIFNHNTATSAGGKTQTISSAEVDAFPYNGQGANLNAPTWKWSPLEVTPYTTTLDNTDAQSNPANWVSETNSNHFGVDYQAMPIVNDVNTADAITYKPTLDDGDYQIQVYCGGNLNGEQFGAQTTLFVAEGATVTQIAIDQTTAGWVTISNQRFKHRGSIGEPLTVAISNYSPLVTDVGSKAYADEVRFVGSFNETVSSTPVQTKAMVRLSGGGGLVEKDVVVVAADDGHIYCLDALGNGNGTTTLYWAYPTILPPNDKTATDPNWAVTADGDGKSIITEMPVSGFGFSSPVVQRLNGADYCYIAANNGRVYCVDMAGRGDYTSQRVGTTSRNWSYPNDYPAVKQSPILGGFGGSIALSTANQTVYVPALEGRLYALDAAVNQANHTTTAKWAYPKRNVKNLGPVTTTPTVDFGKVYFGTARLTDDVPGQFYALNANTGALAWTFEGDPAGAQADNFLGGPCTATAAQLNIVGTSGMVFCSNQNLYVYGLDADTGAMLWDTNELNTGVSAPLMFTYFNVPDQTGTAAPFPILMVPTDDGRFDGLFARAADVNVDNTKLAWEYISGSDSITASMANGWNFMYGVDMAGNLFAWGNGGGIAGMGSPPGSQTITQNNPIAQEFRQTKIVFLTRAGYVMLRNSLNDGIGDTGTVDYTTIINGNPPTTQYIRQQNAFEWGETAYLLVYDFPFLATDPNGAPVNPPVVNFQIGVEGASVRQYGVQAKKWASGNPPNLNGYAILAFPIQGAGPTSIPPGSATVKTSFTSTAGNTAGQPQNIAVSVSKVFTVANPIGLYMPDPNTGAIGSGNRAFGTSPNPTDIQRNTNGTRGAPQLGQSEGVAGNGQTGVGSFWVVDMSMMTLLKGPNRGLESVRVTRPDLAWQGGPGAVWKAIDQNLYPGFEDLPGNFPNTSIDYPNIDRTALRVTKDPGGTAENALVSPSGVELAPPNPYDENNIVTRIIHPVPFEIDVDVPRFQPANNNQSLYFPESGGVSIPSGYLNRLSVYVDSNGNSTLDSISGRREAFRSWTTNLAVAVDDRLSVTTPVVDLGTLAAGTGYSPFAPGTANGTSLSPWATTFGSMVDLSGTSVTPITTGNPDYVNLFKTLRIENEGNVNSLNVRLAKGVNGAPWPIYANSVDDLGWLDTSRYVWTNFDGTFGLEPKILIQKARVGDRIPTELSINQRRRYNPNIGVTESFLFPTGPIGDAALPRIAASPPVGFPIGQYSQTMEIIDDLLPGGLNPGDQSLQVDGNNNPLEVMSSPTFTLKMNVRETRFTTGYTIATAPFVDIPTGPTALNAWTNLQPAGIRWPSGSLVAAWVSSRTDFNDPVPTKPDTDPQYRIYVASITGTQPSNSVPGPTNDLGNWSPSGNRWVNQSVGPYPVGPYDALFQTGANESIIAVTAKFGSPAFSSDGLIDPLGGANFKNALMAFVGQVEKQGPNGRNSESRIMVAPVSVGGNGAVTVGSPIAMPFDPNTPKFRPAIYQVQRGAAIFYGASGSGEGGLFYTVTSGTSFSQPVPVALGNGFEQLGSPSATIRNYTGAAFRPQPIVELSFNAKLRGRSNTEVFYTRMSTTTANVNGAFVGNAPNRVIDLPSRLAEKLAPDTENGVYRAQGVLWNSRKPITVYQDLDGTIINLETDPTKPRIIDRQSGLIRFDCKLGGQIYLDPSLGTVRFANAIPVKKATILLDYTPDVLRISESTVAGHGAPSVLWDNRIAGDVSNYSYWFDIVSNGALANVPSGASPRPARNVFMYTRAASGAGEAARPYWKSVRVGVQLPTPIFTDASGTLGAISITPASGPPLGEVQVDPANGRIYFQSGDEDRVVNITYTGLDENNPTVPVTIQNPALGYSVGLVTERAESEVPVDQAVNESSISPFLDPFDNNPRRPGLIWMFFVSTRAGSPDLYFQTMAPRFTPIVNGK